MSLQFTDLSVWDLGIIKSLAINILITTRENDRYVALADAVLSCIKAKGYNFSDESNLVKRISKSFPSDDGIRSISKKLTFDEVILLIFEYLKSNNIVIIKDESREPTWSKEPKPLHYEPYNKPWMMTWKN